MNLNRRLALKTLVATGATAALGSVLAACGGGTSTASTTGNVTASATTAKGATFPVTIKSALGEATIKKAPERIVTLSWINQDVSIALGAIPVGMPKFTYGGDAQGFLPWDAKALKGKTAPALFEDAQQLPLETIASLKPDVILAAYSGLTAEEFATLSKIAPTVAYPEAAYATSWEETTTVVGQALGKNTEALALIEDTKKYIATETDKYPEIKGKTFVYAASNEDGILSVYKGSDVRVQFVASLGLTTAPSVAALAPADDQFFYPLSFEKLADLKSDILVAYFADEAALAKFKANKLVAAMPQVASGAFAAIVGESYIMASSAPSSLSIPYMLPEYLKQISGAVAKVK